MPIVAIGQASIEGNPFITRFKTIISFDILIYSSVSCIEGNPFITRFKTFQELKFQLFLFDVLKVIHL